tara:strand:- start:44 stop:865 length:822 start_codon:yes stop_codon:yes gene_type:complete
MKKLAYLFLTVLIVACSGEDSNNQDNNDGDNNQSSCNGDNPVYLDDNGVTIKAKDCASVGDTGVINGIEYTVADRELLSYYIDNILDVSTLCTTRITNMENPYFYISFNDNISGWDVSNVTTMEEMFGWGDLVAFNQDLSFWDVSSVRYMNEMFDSASSFNSNISTWDVGNVIGMRRMFSNASSFNQDISNWDTSNVFDMGSMFYNAEAFNLPIGDWDVSNVTDMGSMFWVAVSFNQDLSSWSVDNVNNCGSFSFNTPQWTLPKPNFTNCDPN